MFYIFILFILCCGYYTFTYGASLWRDDKNKLAGFGAVMIAILGTLGPIAVMLMKR